MLKKMILKRLLQMIVVLIIISFLTFLLTYLAPGDPAEAMYEAAGISPTEEQLNTARLSMGLDKPFIVQYGRWVTHALRGDLGTSFSKSLPVATLIGQRLLPTLKIAVFSMAIMLVVSIPLGLLSATHQDGVWDYLIRFLSFFGISMPGFWLGLLLMYVFCVRLHWLPAVSASSGFREMILPSVTLAIAMSSKYTRQVRASVLEELSQDYVIGARARGVRRSRILWRHVFKNALLPLITLLGISFGSLLGGTSIVEIVFAYPGLGNLAVQSVSARDYPLIQGVVLWVAMIYMAVNLVVDLTYDLVDPRIREAR
ncbi:MAG: ABC transporter permease [Oscillospiraceae bacterium]|nr:ABC transporter permease [Oscillospiraceae bacterium]